MRRKKVKDSESKLTFEMTPMIDVVFNLLIFFLCSPFKIPEGQLDAFLPKGVEGMPIVEVEKVLVVLKDTGEEIPKVFVGYRPLPTDADGQPSFDKLALILMERKKRSREISDEKLPVEIDGGERVQYRYVVGVLNACTKARIEEIRFTLPIGRSEKPPG